MKETLFLAATVRLNLLSTDGPNSPGQMLSLQVLGNPTITLLSDLYMISVRYLTCSVEVLSMFPNVFKIKLFIHPLPRPPHQGLAASEKRGVVLLSFLKLLTFTGFKQRNKR